MILNYDYRRMLKTGFCLDKHTLRREHEAGTIVFWCMAGAALIIFAVAIQSCGMAGVMR